MSEEKPLLIFPPPGYIRVPTTKQFSRDKITVAPFAVRDQRLSPQFDALQRSYESKEALLSDSPLGTLPEQVLVLETIGSISDFIKAVRKIRGMEWLFSSDASGIAPDEWTHFEDLTKAHRSLPGQMFMILTNASALRELLSLWRRYKANQNMQFKRGLAKWRQVFEQLRTIRLWGVEDRLRDTGILTDWHDRIKEGKETLPVEIETWYGDQNLDRSSVTNEISRLIANSGGKFVRETILPQIAYHGILAELPITSVSEILLGAHTELVKCDQVMFFRPNGQIAVYPKIETPEDGGIFEPDEATIISSSPPIVALLDGLPLVQHAALNNSLIVDDPDAWGEQYPTEDRLHGTAMASLILNGDLSIQQETLARKIYVRPIIKSDPASGIECVPENNLLVDLIHRAVVRIFGTRNNPGVAPTIRIINFSIGDLNRQFTFHMSPLARLIDWLSWTYNVLFVVSAGNQGGDLTLPMTVSDFEKLSPSKKQTAALRVITEDARNRRLLSPAESINALTVGAQHADYAALGDLHGRTDLLFSGSLPSPISALGMGFKSAIKPEILMPGGRVLFSRHPDGSGNTTRFRISRASGVAPGLKVASPSSKGDINRTSYTYGTSNAAALTTRAAAQLFEILNEIYSDGESNVLDDIHLPCLIKCLIGHSASWGSAAEHIQDALTLPSDPLEAWRISKGISSRLLGYGAVNVSRVFECSDTRVSLISTQSLHAGGGHKYFVPIPEALWGSEEEWRLIVTLAWFSPINSNHQKYKQAALWFEIQNNLVNFKRKDVSYNAVRRGTLQHEIFFATELDVRSRPEVELFVYCRANAGEFDLEIPYGLSVTWEYLGQQNLPIYDQVKEHIAIRPI